jgi:diguanylate cyclase (GGDEF)-like protein
MIIAFFGIQVPLLTLIIYSVFSNPLGYQSIIRILVFTVLASLLGTAFTLYFLYYLLFPVTLASSKLREYITDKKMPDLPSYYKDEAGQLMADVQYTVSHIDKLIRSLEKTSITDYLTGIDNRFAAEKRLKEDIARSSRGNNKMSLILLDLDDFKRINDQYGHDIGDFCLKHAVNILKTNVRESDWMARWGGDEIMIMLFDSDEVFASKVLERIILGLEENPIPTTQGLIKLTISVGVSQFKQSYDFESFFKKTDTALLEAKRRGKGQIVYSSKIDIDDDQNVIELKN